jgi:hypothetical protein
VIATERLKVGAHTGRAKQKSSTTKITKHTNKRIVMPDSDPASSLLTELRAGTGAGPYTPNLSFSRFSRLSRLIKDTPNFSAPRCPLRTIFALFAPFAVNKKNSEPRTPDSKLNAAPAAFLCCIPLLTNYFESDTIGFDFV